MNAKALDFIIHHHNVSIKGSVDTNEGHSLIRSELAIYGSYVSLEHRRSHKQHSYINNTLYGSKLYTFFYAKNHLHIKIMFHDVFSKFHTINISKFNFDK